MANKEFKIQSDTVSLNGVPLSSSVDGKVVIPGVTRASGYQVEEVEDNGDQTYQFAPNSEIVVIDLVLYNAIIENGDESLYADYTATTDDEGYIDEIEVNGQGTYTGPESYANGSNNMKAYIGAGSASDRPLVEQDWISIPFRPKMKATGVESEFEGGVNLSSVSQHIIPSDDITYDLGSVTKRWRDLYLSGNTITLGTSTISSDPVSGAVAFSGGIAATRVAPGISGLHRDLATKTFNDGVYTIYSNDLNPAVGYGGEFIISKQSGQYKFGYNGSSTSLSTGSNYASYGTNWTIGQYTVPGTLLGGASPANDMVISCNSLTSGSPYMVQSVAGGNGSWAEIAVYANTSSDPTDVTIGGPIISHGDWGTVVEGVTVVFTNSNFSGELTLKVFPVSGELTSYFEVVSNTLSYLGTWWPAGFEITAGTPSMSSFFDGNEIDLPIDPRVDSTLTVSYMVWWRGTDGTSNGTGSGSLDTGITPIILDSSTWDINGGTLTVTLPQELLDKGTALNGNISVLEFNPNGIDLLPSERPGPYPLHDIGAIGDYAQQYQGSTTFTPAAYTATYDSEHYITAIEITYRGYNWFLGDNLHFLPASGPQVDLLVFVDWNMEVSTTAGSIGSSSSTLPELTVTGDLVVDGDIHVKPNSIYLGTMKISTDNGSDLLINDAPLSTGGGATLAPQLTKVDDEIVLTGTLHLGQAAGGSISELDSEGNVNFWFNSATGDIAGRKYAVGNDGNGGAFVICFGTDGSAVWTYTFDQIDFGGSLGLQNVYPFVSKHWVDTNDNNAEYIYVGFDSSSYIGVVKFRIDGTVDSTWVYTHSEDPNLASFDMHDMAIDPENGNFTIVGRMYGEWIPYNLVSAQPGTNSNVLVVNRSDVGNVTNLNPYENTSWNIDIDGNGSWFEPANGGINAFYNMGLYSISGNGGQQIYTESQHYTAGGLVIDATGTPFLKLYTANWTNTAKRDFLLSLGATQTYNFVCAPGSLYTFTANNIWIADGNDWTLEGSFTQVAGDSLSTAVNITNFYFNETATGIVRYYIDDDGNSVYDGFNVQVPGSGYVNGEQVRILGSLLGGVDGGYITSLNSIATPVGNTWLFAKNDYPTLSVDAPTGTLIRQGWTNAVGTVVSVVDNGQDQWEVVVTVTSGTPATGGSVEFYAGNDLIANYGIDYGGYLYNVQWLPVQGIIRFNMDQTLGELPEFNIRQSSGDQAFIYSPGFYHTIGGDGNQGFSSVTLDKVNNIVYAMGDFNIPSQADTTIVAFDYSNGDILWQKNVNDNTNWGRAHGIVASNNSLFVPWENDDGDTIITKMYKDGSHLWSVRQSELDNWDNAPQPLVDSEGNLILAGVMSLYNEQQQSWEYEIAVVKLSQVDGSLIFANSLTRLTARTSVYEYYDSDASPWSIVNDKLFFGGYMNDRNNNYNVGVAVSIPADGTGLGSNGDWEYHAIPFTNNPLFTDYTNDVTLNTQNIPHPDVLQISSAEISVTGTTIESIPVLVRAEIIGGSSKFTFEDGGEISQTGIQRHAAYNGNNTITLSADMNGKFLYFANNPNNWNSTIYLPLNANVTLPIGFTVTVVMGDFNGQSIYVNNDGNGDVQILANGNNNMSNWWWGFGGDGNAGVYTIMKVDTNVWMLAGPNVWVD